MYWHTFQDKVNCFWWSLQITVERESFASSITVNSAWNDVYFPQCRGSVDLNSSCNWLHSLIHFMIIHSHFLRYDCFLHRPIRQVKWGCNWNYHPEFLLLQDLQEMNASFLRPGKDNYFWWQRESQRDAEQKDISIHLSSLAHSQGPFATQQINALSFT